uniref:non-specific serine/threonine protein kinase n=1 Tax=Haptolina ericina TaxID=156174 RepID=A0A7S3EZR2_9EUKA
MSEQTSLLSTAVGTPYYLSPELIGGQGYDGRADIWSLGCICFELLALKRPFGGENIAHLAMSILRRPPGELPPNAPPDLASLTGKLLQKEPSERPAALELLRSSPMADWPAHAQWPTAVEPSGEGCGADSGSVAGGAEAEWEARVDTRLSRVLPPPAQLRPPIKKGPSRTSLHV